MLCVVSLAAVGCSSGDGVGDGSSDAASVATESVEPTERVEATGGPAETAAGDRWLNADQRRRIDQLISTFENSTTEIDYAYAENIGDGRGVTAGRAGFTTATCDAAQVIRVYTDAAPDNDLARFLPELDRLCDEDSDDTSGLPEADYIAAWTSAASDDAFRAAQDAVVDTEYYQPAMAIADELGLRSALARAELYDTGLQHGIGDDPDGLPALAARTTERVGTPMEAGESAWLDAFFDVRIEDLTNPANDATAEEWSESTDRVACLRSIADSGNIDLDGPITCTVYGDQFSVE
jgi:chitosanase